MPSVMCSLSAVQSHGSWPPFHGTDAMNEHDGGRHHFLAIACFRALQSERVRAKTRGGRRNVPHSPSLARAGGRAVRHRSVASLPQSYVRGYWLRATRVHVARARPESRGVPR